MLAFNILIQRIIWWAQVGSNHRPLPCEGSALPLSYAPVYRCESLAGRLRGVNSPLGDGGGQFESSCRAARQAWMAAASI